MQLILSNVPDGCELYLPGNTLEDIFHKMKLCALVSCTVCFYVINKKSIRAVPLF